MQSVFIDIASKAKADGVSESTLRGMVKSGKVDCYFFLQDSAKGSQDKYLPCWSEDRFPDVYWQDAGTPYDPSGHYEHGTHELVTRHGRRRVPAPLYEISGWVRLPPVLAAQVLNVRGSVSLGGCVVLIDLSDDEFVPITVIGRNQLLDDVQGGSPALNSALGIYGVVAQKVMPDDLMFLDAPAASGHDGDLSPIDRRRERSLLRIIRALDVMANLPLRGAATALEKQLELMGFKGPNDETIRKMIEEARALAPDKSQ